MAKQVLAGGFPSVISLGEMLRNGACTSVDLVEVALQKIDAHDQQLHAFVEVYAKEALLAAQAADNLIRAGYAAGPLHGIPVALKDNVDVRGRRSTAGSPMLANRVAERNAWITQRLLEAGCVILGKTHMVEFALGGWGTNEFMGSPRNPWGREDHFSSGGSSSGSAVAVAAGMVPLAIGTDTGGSVRVPAAMCGVTGFKPTIHRLKEDGVVPLSTTLDSVGVHCKTAEDAALLFATLTGDARAFPTSQFQSGSTVGLRGVRVGVLGDEDLKGLQPEVLESYSRAVGQFKEQGAHLRRLVLPMELDDFAHLASAIMLSEAASSWGDLAADERCQIDRAVRPRIVAGSKVTAKAYVDALRKRDSMKVAFGDAFGDLDVFLTPTTPQTAQPISGVDHSNQPVRYTRIGNLLDLCAISVQSGKDDQGLPVGLQIAGPAGSDAQVLAVARSYQACTRWHDRHWTPSTG
ncbi:MAG TPA: amidase [Bellilinea sp.]|nr:amidase [Bellilinea sp.]